MQENRSFDHYFGMLPGVRGLSDPHPAPLPSGQTIWYQPNNGTGSYAARNPSGKLVANVMPYPLNPGTGSPVNYQGVNLNHDWKGSQSTWANWNAWIQKKGYWSMGYLKPADLPFYYALANAFTVCDAYHCSLFGPTNPNRRYLWTGTSGAGTITNSSWTHYIVENDDLWESNVTSDPANDRGQQNGWDWKTYADVLEDNQVNWKVYQGYGNYGDNALAYFNPFRRGGDADKIARARSYGGKSGDNDAQSANGLIAALQADLAAKDANGKSSFPAVSWIVAPYTYCEHPTALSSDGESFAERVINTVIGSKDVWSKCAIFITYDENDGYFDHVPPPIPPLDGYGKHNLQTAAGTPIDLGDETYQSTPIGLGPRVPMMVVSPWSKGGRVSSRLSDHTSVIRFLETWLTARGYPASKVQCPNISAWRRAVRRSHRDAEPGGARQHAERLGRAALVDHRAEQRAELELRALSVFGRRYLLAGRARQVARRLPAALPGRGHGPQVRHLDRAELRQYEIQRRRHLHRLCERPEFGAEGVPLLGGGWHHAR